MDNTHLPPLPAANQSGPEVCAVARLYLAVIDDLTKEQVALLNAHVATCAACGEEFRILERATWLVGSAVATAPSPRVDAAIRAMIEGRRQKQQPITAPRPVFVPTPAFIAPRPVFVPAPAFIARRPARRRRFVSLTGGLVTAAIVMLALFASLHFSSIFDNAGKQNAFALPGKSLLESVRTLS